MLLLGVAFAAKLRFVPQEAADSSDFVSDPRWHIGGQYLLALMTLSFYMPPRSGLSTVMVLQALAVILCAVPTLPALECKWRYQFLMLSYVVLAAMYCGAHRKKQSEVTRGQLHRRRLASGIILAAALAGGWAGGEYLDGHHQQLRHLLAGLNSYSVILTSRLATEAPPVEFSDTGQLNSISRVQKTAANRPALRVLSREKPGYLRTGVFDLYAGSKWKSSSTFRMVPPSDRASEHLHLPGDGNVFVLGDTEAGPWQVLDIWPAPGFISGMFTPRGTTMVRAPVDVVLADENNVVRADDLLGGLNYGVAAPKEAEDESLPDRRRRRYLQVPSNLDPMIHQLAEAIFVHSRNPAEKIAGVEEYFQDNYMYQLGAEMPDEEDPVTFFLTSGRAGHCEYFATGAAVLLRLVGVPTRYVTGFVVVEHNPYGEYWIARYKDAHAWVEAWDDQRSQWVLVEATPATSRSEGVAIGKLGHLLDYFRFRLQELRVVMHRDGFVGLAHWLFRRLIGGATLMFTTSAGLAITTLLVLLALGGLLRKMNKRKQQPTLDPCIVSLHRLLKQMDNRLKRHDPKRAPTETLHQFASRLEAQGPHKAGVAAWYLRYARVRYRGQVKGDDLQQLKDSMPATIGRDRARRGISRYLSS